MEIQPLRKLLGCSKVVRHPALCGTLPGSPEGTPSEESWHPSVVLLLWEEIK